MKNKIGIILTTFLRDNLMYQTVQTILNNWNENYILFIGNQSYKTDNEKSKGFSDFCLHLNDPAHLLQNKIHYYNLDYDCGLSYARNFLVQKAYENDCDYILLSADSIQFTSKYNFEPILQFLQYSTNTGIIGLKLEGRTSWERDLNLIPGQFFHLTLPKQAPVILDNIMYQPVDICKNFFIAKTSCLRSCLWDDDLKLGEHEDYFWRLKTTTSYKVYYTEYISATYVNSKPNEYNKMRRRLYNEFIPLVKQKYNIKVWTRYER